MMVHLKIVISSIQITLLSPREKIEQRITCLICM